MARRLVHIFKSLNKTLRASFGSLRVTSASCCPRSGGQRSRRACVQSAGVSSSPFPVSGCFSTKRGGFSVQFFPLGFSLHLLLLSSLLLQIFSHRHSQATSTQNRMKPSSSSDKGDTAFRADDSFYLLASSFCISFQLLSINLSA